LLTLWRMAEGILSPVSATRGPFRSRLCIAERSGHGWPMMN
jgi:hypothetical protein